MDALPLGKIFLGLTLILWIFDPQKRWTKDPTNKWMTIFLLLIVVSSFNAYWPDISRSHFMDFFGWFIIYFLVINVVNNQRRFFIFLIVFLLASFKLSQHGARTWAMRGFSFTDWGLMGPEGFFQNSGELAIQMLIYSPIAYHFAIGLRPWISKFKFSLLMLLPITGAMTILGSSTRGGQLGLAVQLLKTFVKRRPSIKVLLLAIALGAGAWHILPEEQKARFTSAGNDETSQQRLLYWKRGIEMIGDHPVLGVGYFNFPRYFETNYPEDIILHRAELPHNIFIQVGTDMGCLGLWVYLVLIYRAFRSTADIRKTLGPDAEDAFPVILSRGLDTAFLGFLIAGQFVTVGYYPFMWIHLAMVVALKNIVIRNAGAPSAPAQPLRLRTRMAKPRTSGENS